MTELAKLIEVVQKPDGSFGITVDGVEFPWFVGPEMAVRWEYGQDEMPGVELKLLAERVKVDHRGESGV